MEEEVNFLKLQVTDLKRMIMTTVKMEVKNAVSKLRIGKDYSRDNIVSAEEHTHTEVFHNVTQFNTEAGKPDQELEFCCPLCDKKCESAVGLFTHQVYHPDEDNYNCGSCSKTFSSLFMLTLHYNKKHKDAPVKLIKMLEKVMESRKKRKNFNRLKSYKCQHCHQKFRHVHVFNKHVLGHEQELTMKDDESQGADLVFSCPVCDEKFRTLSKLLGHSRLHQDMQELKCRDCIQEFENVDALTIHQHREHIGTRQEVLEILESSFERRRKGSNTRRLVHYKCEICLEELPTLRKFNYHVVSHEKETCKDLVGFEYICVICGKTFEKMYSLFKHQSFHSIVNELNCLVCNEKFADLQQLTIHHHKEHTEITENMLEMLIKVMERRKKKSSISRDNFKCEQCEQGFSDYKLYTDHVIKHLHESEMQTFSLSFRCPACENDCDTVWKALVHLTDHPTSVKSKCQKCTESFENLNLLTVHYYKEHLEASEGVTKFVKNIVTDALGLGSDPRRQTFRPLACNSCGFKCAYHKQLMNHKYFAHLGRPFCCELCGKQFKQQHILDNHKKTHLERHQKTRISCKECDKTFGSQTTYGIHYNSIHLNQKPYQCKVCSKRFASPSVLHIHKTSVCEKDKAKKRTCPTCERTFDNYLLLYYHKENTHRYGNTEDTVCHLCNKNFRKSVNLHSHNNLYHKAGLNITKEPRYLTCNICGIKRTNRNLLFDHWLTHNDEKAFECQSCEIRFKQRCGFFQHKKTRHKNDKQMKIKIDTALFRELKLRFKILEKSLQSEKGFTEQEMVTLNATASNQPEYIQCSQFPSEEDHNVELVPNNGWSALHEDNFPAFDTHNSYKGNTSSQPSILIDYVDFSRANVPEESLKREITMPPDFVATANNFNDEPVQEAVVDETNDFIACENISADEYNLFNGSLPDLDCCSDDYGSFNDLDFEVEDVKPIIFNDILFSEDPFSKKLIVKLEKIEEYNCLVCNVVLYSQQSYKMHTKCRSHRLRLKDHLENDVRVKEENNEDIETSPPSEKKLKRRNLRQSKEIAKKRQKHSLKEKDFRPCLLCTVKLTSNQALKRHYISQHPGEHILKCEHCKETFLCNNLLEIHMKCHEKDFKSKDTTGKNINVKKNVYNCNVCDEKFTSSRLYKSHSITHKNCKYKCMVCQILCDSQNELESHYTDSHKTEMPFQCEECKEGFPTRSRLELHKENIHCKDNGEKAVKGKYSCEQCGKIYRIRSMLMAHMVRHDQKAERQFICDLCDRSFLIESSLTTHRRIHTGEKPYPCDQCEMSFVSSRQLRQHNNIVHLKRKHVCEICGNSFTKNSKLTVHLRTHTGETPYPCKQCEKSFISSSHLKDHVDQVHLGIKHVCDTCGKMFADLRNLRKHRKRHNSVKPLCPHCHKEYSTQSDLQRHIDVIHLKMPVPKRDSVPKPFICSTCSEEFRTPAALAKHVELHNPNRPFGCELCSCRFNFNSNLVLHRKNVHEKQGIDYWSKGRKAKKANKAAENTVFENPGINLL